MVKSAVFCCVLEVCSSCDESIFLKLDKFVHSHLLQVHANFQDHSSFRNKDIAKDAWEFWPNLLSKCKGYRADGLALKSCQHEALFDAFSLALNSLAFSISCWSACICSTVFLPGWLLLLLVVIIITGYY